MRFGLVRAGLGLLTLLGAWGLVRYQPAYAVNVEIQRPRAWTVCLESGSVAATEIWVAEGDSGGKRLGTFPGRAGSLGWSGERLLYRDNPLELQSYGASIAGQPVAALVPATVWALSLDDGTADPVDPGEARSVAWPANETGLSPCAHPDGSAPSNGVLSNVGQAVSAASSAYSALHQWDYKLARDRYRKAAKLFAALAERPGPTGLYPEPLMPYARILRARAIMADRDGARWVCRDHLTVIGDLLKAYEAGHAGARPGSLSDLKSWATRDGDELDRDTVHRMFRSSKDPDEDREISYLYEPDAGVGAAVLTSPYHEGRLVELVSAPDGYSLVDRAAGEAQVDSLLVLGTAKLQLDDPSAATILDAVTHIAPDLALGHCKLGYARLLEQDLDAADRSFRRAVSLDGKLAEAYNGIGMVYKQRPKGLYSAIHNFQKALRYDNDYLDARYQIATIRYDLGEHDVKHDLDRILATDPAYAPAHLLMGKWYETQQDDHDAAALHYARYMNLRPEDPEGRRRLAAAYLASQDHEKIVELLAEHVRQNPDEREVLSVLAQACLALNRMAWAGRYYGEYLSGIEPEERALYEDASLLMSAEEQAELGKLEGEDREAFVRDFWAGRDPNLMTDVNERRLEHYRRVWYSRLNFSAGKHPWDRRGEMYIRFGEPDFRSRSVMQNLQQSLEVQRVRDRIAREIYGIASDRMSFAGGPVYAVRSLRSMLGGGPGLADGYATERPGLDFGESNQQTGARDAAGMGSGTATSSDDLTSQQGETLSDTELDESDFERRREETTMASGSGPLGMDNGSRAGRFFAFRPVTVQDDPSMVPWETWVYTEIGGGIEITFTDETLQGVFDYAPPPMEAQIPIAQLARFNRFNPRRVAELAALVTPNYYLPPANEAPVLFYYDVASFRGPDRDRSNLEVYLGLPHQFGRYAPETDETTMHVERTVALLNEKAGAVYRRQGDLRFASAGDLTASAGGFVPDQVDLDVPAGRYRLEVMVRDRLSGRQGRYRQYVEVEDYAREGLRLSELELAWHVNEPAPQGKFSKGDAQVIPIPTRTYRQGKSVFVYYEVYNLKPDEFGQTHYKVEYTVGPRKGRQNTGIITQLVKVLTGEKHQVAVGYEQVGQQESERTFTELDLSKAYVGKHYMEVRVTDLVSGETASRKATFLVAE